MSDTPDPFRVHDLRRMRDQASAGTRAANPTEIRPARDPQPSPGATDSDPERPAPPAKSGGFGLPFDPLRLITALLRYWYWIPLGALVLATPAFFAGLTRFSTSYSGSIQLIRRDVTGSMKASQTGEAFKPRQISVATIVSVMQSGRFLHQVGTNARPAVSASFLRGAITVRPERDTDLIQISLTGHSSARAIADLLNLYAQSAADLSARMQAEEASELNVFLKDQVSRIETELATVQAELLEFSNTAEFLGEDREINAYLRELSDIEIRMEESIANQNTLSFRIAAAERELANQNPGGLRVSRAREELARLRARFTDENPQVQDAVSQLAALESEAVPTETSNSTGTSTNQSSFRYSENTIANELYVQLLQMRGDQEGTRQQIAQMTLFRDRVKARLRELPEKGQRYAQMVARQQSLIATRDMLAGRQREAQNFVDTPPGFYRVFAPASNTSIETGSRWRKIIIVTIAAALFGSALALLGICIREIADTRVITAGDLARVLRIPVLARLSSTLTSDPERLAQWRFRTWARLMRTLQPADPARLTIAFASGSAGEGRTTVIRILRDAAFERGLSTVAVVNSPSNNPEIRSLPLPELLRNPGLLSDLLRDPGPQRVELLFDASWDWTLENRSLWLGAVSHWQSASAFILLVELPPLTSLNPVFAAELMPVLVWVATSGESLAGKLTQVAQTLDAADIRPIGSILNREQPAFWQIPALDRITGAAIGLLLFLSIPFVSSPLQAQDAPPPTSPGRLAASAPNPTIAPWQERLTIGAGDVFTLQIYGDKDSIRSGVPVGPDGRISYLEAQSLLVAGLTVDEMREQLDKTLAKYHRYARSIVTPVEWRSKQYYLMGAVVDRGAYTLDRPLTIIEAVARARGVDTGLYQQNTIEMADMTRAFIVRKDRRLPVNFEQLFSKGDLSQNILIEPGDYLYFPSSTVNEVYVLGWVRSPGPLGLAGERTVIGVLTVRGGFAPTAYKKRVLVIRGSLQAPQTFVVDVDAILSGRAKDFDLQPKDIIYVAEKPWQRVEDLLELAVNSYVQAITTTWVGLNIRPATPRPILPRLP